MLLLLLGLWTYGTLLSCTCSGHILLVHSKEAVAVKWTITWLLRQSGRLIKSGWKGNLYSLVCLLFRSTWLSALQTDHSKLNLKLIPLLLSSICSKRPRDGEVRSWEGGGEDRKRQTRDATGRDMRSQWKYVFGWSKKAEITSSVRMWELHPALNHVKWSNITEWLHWFPYICMQFVNVMQQLIQARPFLLPDSINVVCCDFCLISFLSTLLGGLCSLSLSMLAHGRAESSSYTEDILSLTDFNLMESLCLKIYQSCACTLKRLIATGQGLRESTNKDKRSINFLKGPGKSFKTQTHLLVTEKITVTSLIQPVLGK